MEGRKKAAEGRRDFKVTWRDSFCFCTMGSYLQEYKFTCFWCCQERWSFCGFLLVGMFLNFNSGECAILKSSEKKAVRTLGLGVESSVLMITDYLVQTKNSQVLPSLSWRFC